MKRRRVKNEEEGGEKKKTRRIHTDHIVLVISSKKCLHLTSPEAETPSSPLPAASCFFFFHFFFFTVSRQFFFPLSLPVPPSSENDPARARDDSTGSSLSPKSHFLFERNLTPTLKPSPRAISEIQQVGVVGWSADRPTEKKKEKKEAEEIEWRLPVGRRRGLHDTRTAEQGGAENEFN